MPRVIVIGAGAAGSMAAIFAAAAGAETLRVERTRDGGRKILISGGGRCNILPARLDESRFVTDSSLHLLRKMVRAWPLEQQRDPSFLRLLLYSALDGHELSQPFYQARMRRLRELLSRYISRRAREGAFRGHDPVLAARAFLGMAVDPLIIRQVFNQRDAYPQSPEQVAQTYTAIFLDGMRAAAPAPAASRAIARKKREAKRR